MKKTGYLVLVSSFLAACDFVGGVHRHYHLREAPIPLCVEQSLTRMEGVTNVRYVQEQANAWRLTLRGYKRSQFHKFSYEAVGIEVSLEIELYYNNEADYRHSYMRLNTVPPQEHIDRIRPVMTQVEQVLETECEIKGLSSGIEESCSRVKCK